MSIAVASSVVASLERDGIAVIEDFLTGEQLRGMQASFDSRLRHVRWNDTDGYAKERFRHMVEDVLTLDQGFVDAALHPLVKETLFEYLGGRYQLCEAKGWRSLPTCRDFHGWHGDAWYDQSKVSFIPREVKLVVYLTNVRSGFFEYVKGSHQKQAPHPLNKQEAKDIPLSMIIQAKGRAGTAVLFDTSGIHRQSVPILEPRSAVFYAYHDASIPLQAEDVDYYRYHPLLLNAAFLGNVNDEDSRILGFGDQRNYLPAFSRRPKYRSLQAIFEWLLHTKVAWDSVQERVAARVKRITRVQ